MLAGDPPLSALDDWDFVWRRMSEESGYELEDEGGKREWWWMMREDGRGCVGEYGEVRRVVRR